MCWCSYLLTYSWLGRIKPTISPKRLKIERKLQLTAYRPIVVHGLSIAAKMLDLCSRFKVTDFLNAAKIIGARVGECTARFWSDSSLSNYHMARRRGCCVLSLYLADCTFMLENRDSCVFELLDCFLAL